MRNSLCPRTFLVTTTADALDEFLGRSTRATGLPYQLSSPSTGEDEGEGETGKARLKSVMRWNMESAPDEIRQSRYSPTQRTQ